MSNPAAELYEIFSQWRDSPKTSNAARRDIGATDGIDLIVRAMYLVHEVAQAIDRLEAAGRRVNTYRANQPEWVYAILAYRTGWNNNSPAVGDLPDPVMHALDVLADMLDTVGNATRTPEILLTFKVIDERLASVLAAVDEDDTLEDRLKLHIRRVANHLRTCMAEFETYGASGHAKIPVGGHVVPC